MRLREREMPRVVVSSLAVARITHALALSGSHALWLAGAFVSE